MGIAGWIGVVNDKRIRKDQSRKGNPATRQLEFDVVMDQVKRRKEAFAARLTKHLRKRGECRVYDGTLDHKGYARLNIYYRGQHVTIHAHRLFLIMKIRKPIPLEYEAGHTEECNHRNCVVHVRLEHYKKNAATNGGKKP